MTSLWNIVENTQSCKKLFQIMTKSNSAIACVLQLSNNHRNGLEICMCVYVLYSTALSPMCDWVKIFFKWQKVSYADMGDNIDSQYQPPQQYCLHHLLQYCPFEKD